MSYYTPNRCGDAVCQNNERPRRGGHAHRRGGGDGVRSRSRRRRAILLPPAAGVYGSDAVEQLDLWDAIARMSRLC